MKVTKVEIIMKEIEKVKELKPKGMAVEKVEGTPEDTTRRLYTIGSHPQAFPWLLSRKGTLWNLQGRRARPSITSRPAGDQ